MVKLLRRHPERLRARRGGVEGSHEHDKDGTCCIELDMNTSLKFSKSEIILDNPLIAASGSMGHSNELFDVIDPREFGAITIKSLAPFFSPGNPSPRVAATETGMMNSVGLPGPHIQDWVNDELPKIKNSGAKVIMAIWGTKFEHYSEAAKIVADNYENFIAIEVNVSCPNTEAGSRLFAFDSDSVKKIAELVKKEIGDKLPIFIKLSSSVTSVVEIAKGAIDGGADGLTLFNTALGLVIDPYTRKPILGKGAGGYSGAGVFPIACRGVYEIRKAYPDIPIIGIGGVSNGKDAAAMMMCGANAVGFATATFANPRAVISIAGELADFCFETGVGKVSDLTNSIEMPM